MELWQTKKALVHRAKHLIIGYRSPLLLQLGLLWILLLLRHPSTTFSTEWIPQNTVVAPGIRPGDNRPRTAALVVSLSPTSPPRPNLSSTPVGRSRSPQQHQQQLNRARSRSPLRRPIPSSPTPVGRSRSPQQHQQQLNRARYRSPFRRPIPSSPTAPGIQKTDNIKPPVIQSNTVQQSPEKVPEQKGWSKHQRHHGC